MMFYKRIRQTHFLIIQYMNAQNKPSTRYSVWGGIMSSLHSYVLNTLLPKIIRIKRSQV